MFGLGKKQKVVLKEPEPERLRYPEYDMLGFEHDDPSRHGDGKANVAYGIKSSTRIHAAIFGLVGSGKSSILKLLILQNIQRKEGFMVLDPHGELARTVLSLIPKSMQKDVIYVNPASLYNHGRTIRINPLEVKREEERYVVVMSFVNALYNLYRDSWGPRLETVLRNAANALVETETHNDLSSLSKMITDKAVRDMLMKSVSSENVRHFWTEIFEKQYSKEAGSAAYNKMDKILSTPAVASMLDTNTSSIQIDDIIRNRRMLIIDLSTGASDDIAQFIGSMLMNMLYVEAKKRIDVEASMDDIKKNPFYVYVDEAHLFSNYTMSEMLRALRKFGIKMTIATQTINAYGADFAAEINGVCQTIICGKCDSNTAKAVQTNMASSLEELQGLQNHTFAFNSAEGGVPVSGVFKSRPIPAEGQQINKWEDVAKASLETWGEAVSIRKYMSQSVVRTIEVSPLETAILHLLYFENRDMNKGEIIEAMEKFFGEIKKADVMNALVNSLERALYYVDARSVKSDDGDANLEVRYSVSKKAYETYFSWAMRGRRAGSDVHIETMWLIAKHQMRSGNYCKPDLGDEGQSLPDLLIVEPDTIEVDGKLRRSPLKWNEKTALAVEVETDPTKHENQVYKNYKKNFDDECNVWFIVFNDKHRDYIVKVLDKHDVPPNGYYITVIKQDDILENENLAIEAPILSVSFSGGLTEAGIIKAKDGIPQNLPEMTMFEFEVYMALTGEFTTIDALKKNLGRQTGLKDIDVEIDKAVRSLLANKIIRMDKGSIRKEYKIWKAMKDWGDAGRQVVRYTKKELAVMDDRRVVAMFNSPYTNPKTREMVRSLLKKRGWKI